MRSGVHIGAVLYLNAFVLAFNESPKLFLDVVLRNFEGVDCFGNSVGHGLSRNRFGLLGRMPCEPI